jgi:hypothetical protein
MADIAIDNQSRVYIGPPRQISVFDANGRFLHAIPDNLYDNVSSTFAIDSNNNLFILNRNTAQIYKLNVLK